MLAVASAPEAKSQEPRSDTASPRQAAPAASPPSDLAARPTQQGPAGIRYDFNRGARVFLPLRERGLWSVRLADTETGNTLFEARVQGGTVLSSKHYFVPFAIEVDEIDEAGRATEVLRHRLDLRDKPVSVIFPVGTLGDTIAWFPAALRLAEVHGCRLTLSMAAHIIPLFEAAHRQIDFVSPEQFAERGLAEASYATYRVGLFFDDVACVHQPTDFRLVGLHRTAAYILGLEPTDEPPRYGLPDESRPIDEPYVCIATQATSQPKYWNNPFGWDEIIPDLKARGYRVICVDHKRTHGSGLVWNHMPNGAEDRSGQPLVETARWLKHASAFIGLSSGVSWLAWGAGCPVVMISGFTHPATEFPTPYRVINWHACNSCWNDPQHRFDHKDFLWCPRHAGTPRQFECTRLITAHQVIGKLEKIPGFAPKR